MSKQAWMGLGYLVAIAFIAVALVSFLSSA